MRRVELGCRCWAWRCAPCTGAPGGELYPLVLRELRRGLSQALRQTFFEFTRTQTTHRPKHYQVLGRRAMVKAVWEVDRQLAEVSDSFDFLLQVTPANAEQAWREFERSRFEVAPVFQYRPLPADPVVLKRRLYSTPIERVEDPALSLLLRQKQDELDRQITMLIDVNTPRFVHGSLQLLRRRGRRSEASGRSAPVPPAAAHARGFQERAPRCGGVRRAGRGGDRVLPGALAGGRCRRAGARGHRQRPDGLARLAVDRQAHADSGVASGSRCCSTRSERTS